MKAPRPWILVLAGWTAVALLQGTSVVLESRAGFANPNRVTGPFFDPLVSALVWAALTPLSARACRAFPLTQGRLVRAVAAQLVLAGILAVLHESIYESILVVVYYGTADPGVFAVAAIHNVQWNLHGLVAVSFALSGIFYALEASRRAHEEALAAAELGVSVAEARLEAVARGFDPALVLEALDELVPLIHTSPADAEDLVERLGDRLRAAARGPVTPRDGGSARGSGDGARSSRAPVRFASARGTRR